MAISANDNAAKGAIRPIAGSDVHRITSGQVVLDLQTAVKELVENALDAGSTNIAIHFKDYGCESFEVVDNGSGLDPSNYESVALKHYTSKLTSFSDLALVRTFGFRGEALSSLCALAEVSIHTATQNDAPVGTILQLERSGKVADSSKRAARQRGTTITITGLFKSLPVRRKEFEKNLKREYNKAQNLLQAYALITKGVRWSTTNIPKAGRRIPQFSVNSSTGDNFLAGNVASLFGAKVTPTLMPLALDLAFSTGSKRLDRPSNDEDSHGDELARVRIEGLISKPSYGSGRTSSDRQFYYINGRPWDAGRISRAFNEVYKSFNSNQLPFVIADFKLPTDSYDVNVSPDKRTIFLHEESRLIEKVKEGLEALFAPSRATFMVNGASHSLRTSGANGVQSRLGPYAAAQPASDSPRAEIDVEDLDEERGAALQAQNGDLNGQEVKAVERLSKRNRSNPLEYREESDSAFVPEDDGSEPETLFPVIEPIVSDTVFSLPASSERSPSPEVVETSNASWSPKKRPRTPPAADILKSSDDAAAVETLDTSNAFWSPTKRQRAAELDKPVKQSILSERASSPPRLSLTSFALPGSKVKSLVKDVAVRMDIGLEHDTALSSEEDETPSYAAELVLERGDDIELEEANGAFINPGENENSDAVCLDMATLRGRLLAQASARLDTASQKTETGSLQADEQDLQAHAGIDSRDEALVERALSRVMHKADFGRMEVVGQFNLGFIIARRRTAHFDLNEDFMDDLFIVDQHASDEKYNFEQLQETTRVQSQDLIVPRGLELSASDELVAIEHQATLSKNGFEISILESGPPGTRIKLLSQPISKTTVFGVKDLEELLYMLRDVSPDSEAARAVRCSKARSMFASRACRKSIMIGTALSKSKMKSILTNMGTIEQPWNCPHGRPTMRHLTCLKSQDQQAYLPSKNGYEDDHSALGQFLKL